MTHNDQHKYVNLAFIKELADGDDDFLIDIIGTYLTSVPDNLAKMKTAVNKGDNENITFYAHKLRGSFNFIGCTELSELFMQIEECCKTGHAEHIPKLLNEAIALSEKTTTELQEIMNGLG